MQDPPAQSDADPALSWVPGDLATVAAELRPGHVHLWRLPLDRPPRPVHQLRDMLSGDERERADGFHFALDRSRFESARGLLRHLLGAYVRQPAGELRFKSAAAGKPTLVAVPGQAPIEFNLSHSGGHALLGVTRDTPLGVDLEARREVQDFEQIAGSNFAPAEVAALSRLPAERRQDGFFAAWTRKEACAKAVGGGLSIALDRFEVTLDPQGPAALLAIDGNAAAAAGWSLWGMRADRVSWAAVAAPATGLVLQRWCLARGVD